MFTKDFGFVFGEKNHGTHANKSRAVCTVSKSFLSCKMSVKLLELINYVSISHSLKLSMILVLVMITLEYLVMEKLI